MDIASLLNTPPISPHCSSGESDKTCVQIKPQSTGTTWSLGEANLAATLKAQGKSWDDISRALPGRSAHACSEYDRRNNPLDHRRRWSPEDIALLDIMVGNRTPWTEISEKLGRGIAACRIRYKRLSRARDLAREKENWVEFIPQNKPLSIHERNPSQGQGDAPSKSNSPGFAATSPVFSPGPVRLTLEEEQANDAYWDNYFNVPSPEPMKESFNSWWNRLYRKQDHEAGADHTMEISSPINARASIQSPIGWEAVSTALLNVGSQNSTNFLNEPTLDEVGTRLDYPDNTHINTKGLGPQYFELFNWARNHLTQLIPVLGPVLRDRLAYEHARRTKRLDEIKQEHVNAIIQGKCKSGRYCCARHDHVHVESGYKTGHPWVQGQSVAEEHLCGTPRPLLSVNMFPAEFECPLCFNVKKIKTPSDWTKHLFEDIQPFICTFPDCANPGPFKRKADWIRHENERHRQLKYWECSLPGCEYKAYRKDNFVQHLAREHDMMPNSRYPIHHPTRQVDEVSEFVESCSHKTTKNPQEEPCRFCGGIYMDWTRLIKHVGEHLEVIALRTLR
ncbi:hypothetical protein ASPCAL15111 [Aspergillus calidoustus]|uniref:Myb-like domain-containing protein n=1 Tax=Aspergillus calidoustus TaxID=454130 RepID=A0A0U5GHT0_ASPCI|nr:hypothetical protein ASPCAL15111 [Aspergillus calidoustus]